MGFRQDLALNVTPLLLRIGLGVVFLWAGGSKILYKNTYSGEQAAVLANLGIVTPVAPGVPAVAPPEKKPEESPAPVPAPTPQEAKPAEPTPAESAPAEKPAERKDETKPESAPSSTPTTTPAPKDSPPPAPAPAPQRGPSASAGLLVLAQAGGAVNPAQPAPAAAPAPVPAPTASPAARVYTAADFATPVSVPRLYSLALLMHASSQPDEKGRQLWPARLSSPGMIKTMCWAAALTEFLGGALVLVGFLTRLWGLALAGTMAVAMLLTTVGPAVLSGSGFLGFLPPPMLEDQSRWVGAWTTLLFQFVLLLMGVGLALSGPGAVSIDRLLFRTGGQRGSSGSKE